MSTKFFNNQDGNTIFEKLKGIAKGMADFHSFWAVVGFFRSSGYFKLRKELGDVPEIKILVGINVDKIFAKHNHALIMLADPEKVKNLYFEDLRGDVMKAEYSQEVEEGILQMFKDLMSRRLQIRIHPTHNLHAKFYLCLPKEHSENTDGWVIMGSSNISASGLGINQPPQYELNVAMKDYDDVKYCSDEFRKLWEEGVSLEPGDIPPGPITHLNYQPTPYEIYMKVLIDVFGDQVEDDFTIEPPKGYMNLKYQQDAVVQGYQMLKQHNGLILADVVGLGKTIIATMIATRFIEENGKNTKILVVYPPALRSNWVNTFSDFNINKYAKFVSNGSLSKILENRDGYSSKEEFNLIIVDEAHGFRNDSANRYDELQRICKSDCTNLGMLKSRKKKVMLLSATPLNNTPKDLLNLLLLFQDNMNNTIEGISSLKAFFTPHIAGYKQLMRERLQRDVTADVDRIYEDIRNKVIDKVTIRRTRKNIENEPSYCQEIKFPKLSAPEKLVYRMDTDTSKRFYYTLKQLTDGKSDTNPDGNGINYARYRAIEFLKPECREKYGNAVQVARQLSDIYRVHMVKRLESSFYAFKQSLQTFLNITNGMIKMFEEDKVIIAPELKVKDLQENGLELDQIIDKAIEKGYLVEDIVFKKDDFQPDFIDMLGHDKKILEELNNDWAKENEDPKFDLFVQKMKDDLFNPEINQSGKLVLFSESVDTLNYLEEKITEKGRKDVLKVTSENRRACEAIIKNNFDANSEIQSNDYNIIITSDVLAEGINLHRSNVIVNYDSPWNATRLMQRIGRVNRVGSNANLIYNYMFYPSQEGDEQIQLYTNALIKLQGFHSAFGEDAQIYTKEEILKDLKMYDSDVKDSVDERLALLREVRELYTNNKELYNKIKALPMKSRTIRNTGENQDKSVVFISSDVKTDFYLVADNGTKVVDFLDAVKYLKAEPDEESVSFMGLNKETKTMHYNHVVKALELYRKEYIQQGQNNDITIESIDNRKNEAVNFLRRNIIPILNGLEVELAELLQYLENGTYNGLVNSVIEIKRQYLRNQNEGWLYERILELYETYHTDNIEQNEEVQNSYQEPKIVVSETFI